MLIYEIGVIILGIAIMILIIFLDKDYIKNFDLYKSVLLLFLLLVVIFFKLLTSIDLVGKVIRGSSFPFFDNLSILLISISLSLILELLFSKAIQTLQEKIKIYKLEKSYNREIKSYDYYREILKETSPAIIAFSREKKVRFDDVIVATLLSLEKRNKIKLENNEVILITDIENSNLFDHEKLILDYFSGKISLEKLKNNFIHDLFNDMEKEKIIAEKKANYMAATNILVFILLWLILFVLIMLPTFMVASTFGIFIYITYVLAFLIIPIYAVIESKFHPVVRTKKSLEIAAKINGLKKYILDFSNISKTGIDNFKLFDDYVIYAIILNIPGKLDKESKLKYQNLISR